MDESDYSDNDDEWDRAQWLRPELVAPWWEIVLVLVVMLGPFAYSSATFAVRGNSKDFLSHIVSNQGMLRSIAVQSGLLACYFSYLRWRGWTPADFKIRIDWQGTLIMPAVIIAAALANLVTASTLRLAIVWIAPHPNGILAALMADSPHIPRHSIVGAWTLIFVGSIINAFIEELVFMGYAFNQFAARRGTLFALMCMVFLRMLLHTYKGPIDMLGIAAFSFVFGYSYIHLRRLWPLIFGHACVDIIAFSFLKFLFGK